MSSRPTNFSLHIPLPRQQDQSYSYEPDPQLPPPPIASLETEMFASRFFARLRYQSNAQSKLLKSGSPKNGQNKNRSPADLIARTVMRHPSEETRKLLCHLHRILKSLLESEKTEGLQWLLEGSSQEARGGFRDTTSLCAFFNKDPRNIPSSRLITGIETLLSSIAYRRLAPKCKIALPPQVPETAAQRSIYDRFPILLTTADHATVYSDSRSCVRTSYPHTLTAPPEKCDYDPCLEFLSAIREEISDASDTEELPPPRRNHVHIFKKTKEGGDSLSWVGAAHAGNIPIRASLSASACLSLQVALFLLTEKNTDEPIQTPRDTIIDLLTGAIFIPTYLRADYHSIAETAAASLLYKKQTHPKPTEIPLIGPQDAFHLGFQLMEQAANPDYKIAIHDLTRAILERTIPVEYQLPKENLEKFGRIEKLTFPP